MPEALKSFMKFVIMLFLVLILGFVGIASFKGCSGDTGNTEEIIEENLSYETGITEESLNETLASTPSDISGLSQLDKQNMGLEIWDGSDSDCDGLTDKDEIEKYGSDPLKSSTSGDLYSDSYKLANNMDLFTFYDYDKEYTPKLDESNGTVLLTPMVPTDTLACIKEKSRAVDGYNVYKTYWIQSFGGYLKIDVSAILEEHGLSMKDIVVLKNKSNILQSEVEKYDVSKEGNFIVINEQCNPYDSYLFCIASKKGLGESIMDGVSDIASLAGISFDAFQVEKDGEVIKAEVVMFGFPVKTSIGGEKALNLWYVDTGDASINQQEINVLVDSANYYSTVILRKRIYYTADDCIAMPYKDIKEKIDSLAWLDACNYKNRKEGIGYYASEFFVHGSLNDLAENIIVLENPDDKKENVESISSFNHAEETFPFTNFGSYVSPGGNCAGIAYVTACLHNTGTIGSDIYYDSDKYGYFEYNLNNHSELSTLLDYGLNDYEHYDWLPYNEVWEDTNGDGKKEFIKVEKQIAEGDYYENVLTESQKEFVDMIATYWAAVNDASHQDIFSTYGKNGGYDYSMIEKMKKSLDNGKILICCYNVRQTISNGHCINITGYKVDENDPDVTYFFVYDNNYRYSETSGGYNCDNYITVTRVESPYYVDGTFSWSYYPTKNSQCWGTSDSEKFSFIVMDEEFYLYNTSFFKADSDRK